MKFLFVAYFCVVFSTLLVYMLTVRRASDHVVLRLQTINQRREFVVDTKWTHSGCMAII